MSEEARNTMRGLKLAEGFTDLQEEHRRGNRPAAANTRGNNAGMAVGAARGLYQQRACKPDAGRGCVVGAVRPVGIRCADPTRARERAGQELSDGGRGHASGGSGRGAGQTKQRDCGAGDGLPTRQTGRDTISADKRTLGDRARAAESRSSPCGRGRATVSRSVC